MTDLGLNFLSKIMVPIKMSAMMASNKVYITFKYQLTQFTGIVTTQITILQHFVLKQIMKQLRVHDLRIDYCIHRFLLQSTCITFSIVWVVTAFYHMNNIRGKNHSCLL